MIEGARWRVENKTRSLISYDRRAVAFTEESRVTGYGIANIFLKRVDLNVRECEVVW